LGISQPQTNKKPHEKSLLARAALATPAFANLSPLAPIGRTGSLTATAPRKDGDEHITISYKLPGEPTNRSLTGTASGITGKPRNGDNKPQTTPEEKATDLAGALQDGIDADYEDRAGQTPPQPPSGFEVFSYLDTVLVGLPGGTITKVKKTNNTGGPGDTTTVSPPGGSVAMGEGALARAISGAASETGGTAQLWLQIGWEEYTIPTVQGRKTWAEPWSF